MDSRQVTDIFVEKGYLTPEQAEAFIQAAEADSKPIEEVFIESQLVDESGFEIVLAEAIGAEAHSLSEFTADASTLSLIPSGLARLHGVLPVGAAGNTIFVALADPLNSHPLEDIRFALGRIIFALLRICLRKCISRGLRHRAALVARRPQDSVSSSDYLYDMSVL